MTDRVSRPLTTALAVLTLFPLAYWTPRQSAPDMTFWGAALVGFLLLRRVAQ